MAYLLQTIVTQINHAIGAEGIVSMECKTIVSQYGEMIWDLLVSGVCSFSLLFISHFSVLLIRRYCGLQIRPDQVCSQAGLCFLDGSQHVRYNPTF